MPATRYPMKATVMTTGPGVIIATATASTNCCSVSQWKRSTTPPWRNGTMAKPLPNTNAPLLRQALINILDNAIKYSPPGSEIHVRVARTDGAQSETMIEVRDSGPGIPGKHAGRIFDRFYRVDDAR